MSDSMLSLVGDVVFELGKVLIKVEESKKDSAKLIRSLEGDETERILLQKIGKYWNQQNIFDRPAGLVVITNCRLVFLPKQKTITTTTNFLSFPFAVIKDLEMTRVMGMSPAIRFRVTGKEYVFTFFLNSGEVFQTMEDAMKRKQSSGEIIDK
jgi:cystathionine beta-lyase/cystathionine gamma-synthase